MRHVSAALNEHKDARDHIFNKENLLILNACKADKSQVQKTLMDVSVLL